jgi:phosphatidate cytidylyltransferase
MEMSSLAKRVMTAGVLIPVVVAAILFLETKYLAFGLAAIALLAGLEWTALSGINKVPAKIAFVLTLALCLAGTYKLITYPWFTDWVFVFAAIWWFAVSFVLFTYKQIDKADPGVGIIPALICFIVLIPLWAALLVLHQNGDDGPLLLLFLLVLIWVADSGAYFAGHRWGKRKLAPVISPGKSWEGVYGALFGALLCGAILAWYYQGAAGAVWLIPVSVLTVAVSVVGDLFESILKRRMDMKDSGNLLPGHGGMLDRIDSLTAAAPVFAFGLQLTLGL